MFLFVFFFLHTYLLITASYNPRAMANGTIIILHLENNLPKQYVKSNIGVQIRVCNEEFTFFFLNQNICYGYSKEPSHWYGSFQHPKHMFKLMG